jgi:hypothetical protein
MAANGVMLPPAFFGETTRQAPNFASVSYGGFE